MLSCSGLGGERVSISSRVALRAVASVRSSTVDDLYVSIVSGERGRMKWSRGGSVVGGRERGRNTRGVCEEVTVAVMARWSVNVVSCSVVRVVRGRGVWASQWSRQVEAGLKVAIGWVRAWRVRMKSVAHVGGSCILNCKSPPRKAVWAGYKRQSVIVHSRVCRARLRPSVVLSWGRYSPTISIV